MYTLLFATLTGEENQLQLRYKLPVKAIVKGGNFISKFLYMPVS